MSPTRSSLLNGRVVAVLVLQVVGYVALLALFADGDPSTAVETLAGVPAFVLIALAIPAIPAALLAVAVGAVLAAVGLSPESLPAVALARGDVLVFVCAYLVGVAAVWADDNVG